MTGLNKTLLHTVQLWWNSVPQEFLVARSLCIFRKISLINSFHGLNKKNPRKSVTEVPESRVTGSWGSVLGKYCSKLALFLHFSLGTCCLEILDYVTCCNHSYTLLQISFSRKRSPQKPFLALPLGDTRRTFCFLWIPFVLSASWFGVSCWMPFFLFFNHSPSLPPPPLTQHSASTFTFILQ